MRFKSVARTDLGMKRDANEDSIFTDDELGLFIVCDGMGGHERGEVASSLACGAAKFVMNPVKDNPEMDGPELLELARKAAELANEAVYDEAKEQPKAKRMGTTLTLLQLTKQKGVIAHVGDTRVYLMRNGGVHLLTTDHTGAAELVKAGVMSEQAAKNSPLGNLLTRAVGTESSVLSDVFLLDVLPGDRLLLCSDGLTAYVSDRAQLAELLSGDFSAIADRMVDIANQEGGRDNISAIVVEVLGERDEERARQITGQIEAVSRSFGYDLSELGPLQRIMNAATIRNVQKDEVISEEGEAGKLLVVLGGSVERTHDEESTVLDKGAVIGRRNLLSPDGIQDRIVALTDARIMEIDRERFWRLVRRQPMLGLDMLRRLARSSLDLS